MTLYEECIEALGDNYKIVNETDKKAIIKNLFKTFEFTDWGRINWDKVPNKIVVADIKEEQLFKNNAEVYIVWDEVNLPVIKSDLSTVIKFIDDVTAVSFDTWIYLYKKGLVIEFYHDGDIIIGKV